MGLSRKVDQQNQYIKTLVGNIAQLQKTITQLQNRLNYLEERNEDMAQKSTILDENTSRMTAQKSNVVAGFTAYPSKNRSYLSGETMIFDTVVTNYGNHYNPTFSFFTCPISGYYLFSYTLYAHSSNSAYGALNLDGVGELIQAYASYNMPEGSTNMVFTYCEANQEVWVRSRGDHGALLGDPRSTFTGILLSSQDSVN